MVSFEGSEIKKYQALVLRKALILLERGIRPRRGWTWKYTLYAAGKITGKVYTKKTIAEAKLDLLRWATGMVLEELSPDAINIRQWNMPDLQAYFTPAQINQLYDGETIEVNKMFYTRILSTKED